MARGYFIQSGAVLDYRNESEAAITYGDVLPLGARIGVAESDIPAGAIGAVSVAGVYQLPAAPGEAFAVGINLYWDAESGVVTADKGGDEEEGNLPCGFAAAAKAAGMGVALVRIG